jgi:hypothetical protein
MSLSVSRLSLTLRLALLYAGSTLAVIVIGYWIGAAVETHFEEQDRA